MVSHYQLTGERLLPIPKAARDQRRRVVVTVPIAIQPLFFRPLRRVHNVLETNHEVLPFVLITGVNAQTAHDAHTVAEAMLPPLQP